MCVCVFVGVFQSLGDRVIAYVAVCVCELGRAGELSRENGVGKRGPKGGDRMTWASPKRPWGSVGGWWEGC